MSGPLGKFQDEAGFLDRRSRLNENGSGHAGISQQRREVGRKEIPVDQRKVGGWPVSERIGQLPEVLMRIDHHRR